MNKQKKALHICIIITIFVLLITIVSLLILKYEVEGEKNLPFTLSKITIISTAEGTSKEDAENKWNLDISQTNDIYFQIDKNSSYKKLEIIDSILIDNIIYNKTPEIGNISVYKPNSENEFLFKLSDDLIVNDKLEYIGSMENKLNTMNISNQGGTIAFRSANKNVSQYISNEIQELKHDGTLISKTNVTYEQLKYNIQFDFIIKLNSGVNYKTTISLDMPSSNILEHGTSILEIEKVDLQNLIFKRI